MGPGPVAVHPDHQDTGAGSAVIRAALKPSVEEQGERFVTVLGHPPCSPRFGFTRASAHRIGSTPDVPAGAMSALGLAHPAPSGTVRYPAPFGIRGAGRPGGPSRPDHSGPTIPVRSGPVRSGPVWTGPVRSWT